MTTLIWKRLSNKTAKLALVISNVSHKHKSHFLVPQICGCAFIAINQSIVWFSPFSFNFHMWLESSVLFWRDLCLNNDALLLFVSLKLFSEAPQECFVVDVFRTILYAKHSERQFWFKGQPDFCQAINQINRLNLEQKIGIRRCTCNTNSQIKFKASMLN